MFDFGERIIQLRKKEGLSARKLALAVTVDPSTISKIERNQALPSVQILDDIIKYFGISYSDFFNDESNYKSVSIDNIEVQDGKLYKADKDKFKITKDEMEMVKAFRQASEAEKTAIDALLAQYKNNSEDLEVKHA